MYSNGGLFPELKSGFVLFERQMGGFNQPLRYKFWKEKKEGNHLSSAVLSYWNRNAETLQNMVFSTRLMNVWKSLIFNIDLFSNPGYRLYVLTHFSSLTVGKSQKQSPFLLNKSSPESADIWTMTWWEKQPI